MLRGIFQSIIPRVISSHQNGRQIVVDMIVSYQVIPWTPHIHIRQTSILDLEETNDTTTIRNHRDLWDVASLMENIPIVGNILFPLGRRAFSFVSSQLFLGLAPYPEHAKRFVAEDGSSGKIDRMKMWPSQNTFLTKMDSASIPNRGSQKNPSTIASVWSPIWHHFRAIVILVHGAGEHCHRYDWVCKQLNDSKYAVFALDHQGIQLEFQLEFQVKVFRSRIKSFSHVNFTIFKPLTFKLK